MLSPRNFAAASIFAAGVAFLCFAGAKNPQTQGRKPPQSPAKNNLIVEVSSPKLARITLEVRAADLKEPLKYEIKVSEGRAAGGVFVPPGGVREIVASAFDESGKETHGGTQSIYMEGKAIVPRSIRLEPKEAGEPLIVTLRTYDVQLVPQKTSRGTFRVRVNVFDPDGRPANLSPEDVKFGVTDPRVFQLIPFPGGFNMVPGPKPPGELATICDPSTQVFACALRVDCSTFRPCADPWAFIAAAGSHTCGITRSGAAYCWGLNTLGELGANSAQTCGGGPCSSKPLPVKCPPGAPCRFKQVAASETGTCAIDTNNDAWCWGGAGSVVHQQVRAQLAGAIVKFEDVAVGFAHACAISQDRKELWCWGRNDARALGLASMTTIVPITAPVRILVPLKFRKVVAGIHHTCAITEDGISMVCWGSNNAGQVVGPPDLLSPNPPQIDPTCNCTGAPVWHSVAVNIKFDLAAAGPDRTCAHFTSGQTRCWGSSLVFANGIVFPATMSATRLTAGLGQICAVVNQAAFCAGSGNFGELGNGTKSFAAQPVRVSSPPSAFSEIAAGDAHTCGITPNGEAYCWGNNGRGQLGIGTTSVQQSLVPLRVLDP